MPIESKRKTTSFLRKFLEEIAGLIFYFCILGLIVYRENFVKYFDYILFFVLILVLIFRKKSKAEKTELMRAAERGYTSIVKHLLDMGADVNAKDSTGKTALMWAESKGHTETAKLLKQYGAKK